MTALTDALAGLPDGWWEYPEARRVATRDDPLLFAYTYLRSHLRSPETDDRVTFSVVHEEWAKRAKEWMGATPGPMESRHVEVAPRGMGKSTWHFLILPMWAAAHGHVKFIAAFADSSTQAETHLQTFKSELENNELLQRDFPTLTSPMKRRGSVLLADNRAMYFASSGFVFAARGIDSAVLGLKVGRRRPDLIIFDDVEPEEARYSGDQVRKRLGTIRDGILPLNVNARIIIVGTVTMVGSIIHQLVKSVLLSEADPNTVTEAPELWIAEENFRVHHYPAIMCRDDGTEESVWPGRWPMAFLERIRHTRTFAKNYDNNPRGFDGGYWTDDDFRYEVLPGVTRRLLSIDPAVTAKKSSDPSALAVVSRQPAVRRDGSITHPMAQVEHSESVRVTGSELRARALKIIAQWEDAGTPIHRIYIETNQGGDLWKETFHDMPVPVETVHQTVKKELRAVQALSWYQRGRVVHTKRLSSAEEQMIGFPNAPHDDEVDAIGSGVIRLLDPPKKPKAGGTSTSTI